MLNIEDQTACDADFETVLVDLNDKNRLHFSVDVVPERRKDSLDEIDERDTELTFYDARETNDEGAVNNMLCFFVDSACGIESCQPLDSILKTSSTRMSNSAWGKLQDDTEIRRSVEFKGVVIREFGLTLGDHPNAISGPPIRLDWHNFQKESRMNLDEYEDARKPRRSRRQMKLSLSERHRILVHERGHSFSEIKGAWKTALQIREQRIETSSQTLLQRKLDEVWESLCRKYCRFLDRTTSLCF
ncbi:unnamed protein product [Cylindrotheca closterium]|uniref:Uncharacterized protein n=1 Tax=Cylindrotheca closterium TaxID=2856 RepID=A0AAD2FI36_9STRA|nr:unnamed protein product [Cylindrotheca closterium]